MAGEPIMEPGLGPESETPALVLTPAAAAQKAKDEKVAAGRAKLQASGRWAEAIDRYYAFADKANVIEALYGFAPHLGHLVFSPAALLDPCPNCGTQMRRDYAPRGSRKEPAVSRFTADYCVGCGHVERLDCDCEPCVARRIVEVNKALAAQYPESPVCSIEHLGIRERWLLLAFFEAMQSKRDFALPYYAASWKHDLGLTGWIGYQAYEPSPRRGRTRIFAYGGEVGSLPWLEKVLADAPLGVVNARLAQCHGWVIRTSDLDTALAQLRRACARDDVRSPEIQALRDEWVLALCMQLLDSHGSGDYPASTESTMEDIIPTLTAEEALSIVWGALNFVDWLKKTNGWYRVQANNRFPAALRSFFQNYMDGTKKLTMLTLKDKTSITSLLRVVPVGVDPDIRPEAESVTELTAKVAALTQQVSELSAKLTNERKANA